MNPGSLTRSCCFAEAALFAIRALCIVETEECITPDVITADFWLLPLSWKPEYSPEERRAMVFARYASST